MNRREFFILFIIFFLALISVNPQNPVFWIEGYGGNGYAGYPTFNATAATNALIGRCNGIWGNSNGEIFIADTFNHRISKISNGIISTVAGSGLGGGGYTSNTARALSSRLNNPQAVWGDTKGNLYIADTNNHRIRFVNGSSGILSSAAGTGATTFSGDGRPGLNTTLNGPQGIFGDSNGNLFISDTNNNRIRRVAAGTTVITTIMGNGTSGFAGDGSSIVSASMIKSPAGLFLDTSGNLYVADKNNNRIRMISSAGIFSTILGTGAAGTTGDNGPATSAAVNAPTAVWIDSAGNMYFADTSGNRIRRIAAGTNTVRTFAGISSTTWNGDNRFANATSLSQPYGIWGDATGVVIFSDRANRRIRRISFPQRIVTTFAGNFNLGDGGPVGDAVFYSPQGLGGNTAGNTMYIGESSNCRVRKVDLATSIVSNFLGNTFCSATGDGGSVTSAGTSSPRSIFVDTSGNVFVTDSGDGRVRRVAAGTNIVTTVAGSGTQGNYVENITATAARFPSLTGIWADSLGNVYVGDSNFQRVMRITVRGFVVGFAGTGTGGFLGDGGPATSAQLRGPQGMFGDSNLRLYIAENSNARIRVIDMATNIIRTFAGTGTSGNLDKVPALNARFTSPTAIIGDSMGNFFVTDSSRVRMLTKVNSTLWMVSTVVGTGTGGGNNVGGIATLSQISSVSGIWIDTSYDIYITEGQNNRIRKFYYISSPTGQPSQEPTGQPSRQPSTQPTTQPSCQPSGQPSRQPTGQPTGTPTDQPSSSPTAQPTSQPTMQPSSQPSIQPSVQPSSQPSSVPTRIPSEQPTRQPSSRPSGQPTSQPTMQPTSQPTAQPATLPSSQPTTQPSGTPTRQPNCPPTTQPSSQPTIQPTGQPSGQPTCQPTGQPTTQPSSQPTMQPSSTPTRQPTSQPSRRPSGQPTNQPSTVPSRQPTGQPTAQPVGNPSSQPSRQPSSQPTSLPSNPPTSQPSGRPSSQPSCQPTRQPTSQPTSQPSVQPSSKPSGQPSHQPSSQPTLHPSGIPSCLPSSQPTAQPIGYPSGQPTSQPTGQPSSQPSSLPTPQPVSFPTSQPTVRPSTTPSSLPSSQPTVQPISSPTSIPSSQPSGYPTNHPTCLPSFQPSSEPSSLPSSNPVSDPSSQPTSLPLMYPTARPSCQPTRYPTGNPTRQPTSFPSLVPTLPPSAQPSGVPTKQPSARPTRAPLGIPSNFPSSIPTTVPLTFPTSQPSSIPSSPPSSHATEWSTSFPTCHLLAPTSSCPSKVPVTPSSRPSLSPTVTPSIQSNNPAQPQSDRPVVYPSYFPSFISTYCPSIQPTPTPSNLPSSFPTINSPSTQPSSSPSKIVPLAPIQNGYSRFPSQSSSQTPTTPATLNSNIPSGRPSSTSNTPSNVNLRQPSASPQISLFPSKSPVTTVILSPPPSAIPSQVPTRQLLNSDMPTRVPSIARSAAPTIPPSLYPTVPLFSNGTLPIDLQTSFLLSRRGYTAFRLTLFLFSPLNQDLNVYKNIAPSLGKSYVIFGSSDPAAASSNISLWSPGPEFVEVGAGLSVEGSQRSMSLVGDINHDNNEDLVVGNPFKNEAYVVFGEGEGQQTMRMRTGFTVRGEVAGDNLGWAVSSAGDFNGDGFGDVLVSAWQSGRCYVIFGKARGFKDMMLSGLSSVDGLRVLGGNGTSNLGVAVSGAGDFNGDGLDDILLTGRGSMGDNVVYLVYGFKNELVGRVTLDLTGLTRQMGMRIVAPRFSFAGLSLAGVGDVNGDGYADVCIGSVPYKNGYSRQVSYVVYGSGVSGKEDVLLEEVGVGVDRRGRRIEGGGIVVMGAGDVDGDGLNDVMVVDYGDWQGAVGSFLVAIPRTGITRRPSLLPTLNPTVEGKEFPSSAPSISTAMPSSLPSSSPSLPSSRPTSAPLGRYSARPTAPRSPSLSPSRNVRSLSPTIQKTPRPSSSPVTTPSRSPSRPPSAPPTLAPSPAPTPQPSRRPSFRPTKGPTVSPSINRQPTSSPSSSPTLSMSQPWTTTEISSGGYYDGSHRREIFVVDSAGNVAIRGSEGGRSIYKIVPRSNVTITILNFHGNQDIIDLSGFSSPSSLGEVSYRTSPLVLLLGDGQEVVLSSYDLFDLSETNFIFNSEGSSGGSSTDDSLSVDKLSKKVSGPVSMRIVVLMGFVGGVFVLTFLFCHSIHVTEKKARAKKEARLRERVKNGPQLPLPRPSFPVEDRREPAEQVAISSAKTIRSIEIALSSPSVRSEHHMTDPLPVSSSRESSSRSDSSSSQSSSSSRSGSSFESHPHRLEERRLSVDHAGVGLAGGDHDDDVEEEQEDDDRDDDNDGVEESIDVDSVYSLSSLSSFPSFDSDSGIE